MHLHGIYRQVCEPFYFFLVLAGVPMHKSIGQKHYIFFSFPKRRQGNGYNSQTIVTVLPGASILFCWTWAPGKAPFSWPNSSLSRRVSGMAPQLITTNGSTRRELIR